MEVEKILLDEQLLRLLHYSPQHRLDDPLDDTKSDILTLPDEEKWKIIDYNLVSAPKFDDMVNEKLCRIFYYAGEGRPTNSNYKYANQEYVFEIFVHYDYQIIDKRLEMICDRLNELMSEKRVPTTIGKTLFKRRFPVNAPQGYLGFKLIYEFTSNV